MIPSLLVFFKTKTWYEDDTRTNKINKGGVIIISNHRTIVDGIVIALRFFFKRFYFLAADFYKNKRKLLKFIISTAGGIFVDVEGRSCNFMEKCKKLCAKGHSLLIFPEGGFQFAYEPSKFNPGYIAIAVNTGAKIVPVINDFNYGLFKRVHLMIGNSIDLSGYSASELTKEKLNEINEEISGRFLMLFYKLKKKKAEKFSNKYKFISPKKGDVIRVSAGSHYHYGVYLNPGEVIQLGRTFNRPGENVVVNSVSLSEFCGEKIPEVRTLKKNEKKYLRKADDTEKYAKSCIGQGRYSLADNNCIDFVNRVTLNI